ncbi:hypothetical protein B9Z55_026097 [Caenorhabditis nigoni]|nr:hypothetical protein B9Z55_026097 [Caenorhabditis nigoni]
MNPASHCHQDLFQADLYYWNTDQKFAQNNIMVPMEPTNHDQIKFEQAKMELKVLDPSISEDNHFPLINDKSGLRQKTGKLTHYVSQPIKPIKVEIQTSESTPISQTKYGISRGRPPSVLDRAQLYSGAVWKHENQLPVVCKWNRCGLSFTNELEFFEHVDSHLFNKETYFKVCLWEGCSCVKIDNRDTIRFHIRYHTKEKPFRCEEPGCDRRFPRRCYLYSHMRKHSGTKPFSCAVCGAAFERFKEKSTHMSEEHPKKPLLCHVVGCEKRFRCIRYFERHLRNSHGLEPSTKNYNNSDYSTLQENNTGYCAQQHGNFQYNINPLSNSSFIFNYDTLDKP